MGSSARELEPCDTWKGPPAPKTKAQLGPPIAPVVPFCHLPFFGWEGSPTEIDYRNKGILILTCTGGPSQVWGGVAHSLSSRTLKTNLEDCLGGRQRVSTFSGPSTRSEVGFSRLPVQVGFKGKPKGHDPI